MFICLSLPTPFSVGPVNVYLDLADPVTLIDTGPKHPATRAALLAGLAAHGLTLADIRRLVLTHHHADHVGLAGEIVAASGAPVFSHPYNIPWLADYLAERRRHLPFYTALWRESGLPEDMVWHVSASGEGMAQWVDPVHVTHPIAEGDTLTLANRVWTVYHTPGHAGGLVCLFEPHTRTLLANDHLLRDISSNAILEPPPVLGDPRPRRLVEYIHHLHRMAALNPAVALTGHGAEVADVAGLVASRQAFYERRMARLLKLLAERPLTLWELTQATFAGRLTRGMDWFLGLSEILGHLDLLEHLGRAFPETRHALTRWQPATNHHVFSSNPIG